ncbi:DUF2964 family protein [Burkholderia cepacia]|uniref:hypothetical protein n=1 Tax=Burkholderia cepacia TaxID=292 RepID=UPI0038B6FB41
MMRLPNRIVLATLGVFTALASLLGVEHAMLAGAPVLPYAIVALVSGVAAFRRTVGFGRRRAQALCEVSMTRTSARCR